MSYTDWMEEECRPDNRDKKKATVTEVAVPCCPWQLGSRSGQQGLWGRGELISWCECPTHQTVNHAAMRQKGRAVHLDAANGMTHCDMGEQPMSPVMWSQEKTNTRFSKYFNIRWDYRHVIPHSG